MGDGGLPFGGLWGLTASASAGTLPSMGINRLCGFALTIQYGTKRREPSRMDLAARGVLQRSADFPPGQR